MKTLNNIKPLVAGITLGSILVTALSCSSQKPVVITDYEPPSSDTSQYSGPVFEDFTLEELLIKTLDDISTSDILNRDFVNELKNISYGISEDEMDYRAGYYSLQDSIVFYIATSENIIEQQINTSYAGYHELAHYSWKHKLSAEEKDDFRKLVLDYRDEFVRLQSEIEKKPDSLIDDDLYQTFGFDKQTYNNFKQFMTHLDFYKEYYGDEFEHEFYGTEAFAYLVMSELSHKSLALFTQNTETTSILDIREKQDATKELESINHIPHNIRPFYRGFLHDRYFIND